MRKFFIGFLFFLVALVVLGAGYGYYNSRDRHPGYALDLNIPAPAQPQPHKVGFSALKITPYLPDRWTDKNKDAAYKPDDGDTFTDGNNNG
ncbi:MAG: hypothetical protein EOP49_46410, partial [Sphingobacteriales bacterium]